MGSDVQRFEENGGDYGLPGRTTAYVKRGNLNTYKQVICERKNKFMKK